jgi:hypothetical protein
VGWRRLTFFSALRRERGKGEEVPWTALLASSIEAAPEEEFCRNESAVFFPTNLRRGRRAVAGVSGARSRVGVGASSGDGMVKWVKHLYGGAKVVELSA